MKVKSVLNLSNIFKISMKLDYLKFLHISVYFASKTWLNLNNNAFHPRSLYWGAMIPSVRNKLKWKSDLQRNIGHSVGAGPSQSSQSFKLQIGEIGWTICSQLVFEIFYFYFQIIREGQIPSNRMASGTELSEAQIEEYRDAFKLFDADGDGTISVQVSWVSQSDLVNLDWKSV